ncbi:MAG: hypothetical protein KIT87_24540 [Anaerolineae bacterium]|nr:hypothetical protein [Anaerolineae bacterium]
MQSAVDTRVAQITRVEGRWLNHGPFVLVTDVGGDGRGASRGRLHILLELLVDHPDRSAMAQDILALIRDTYYNATGTLTMGLRRAVEAANWALFQYNLRLLPVQRQYGGATLVVLSDTDLYIAQAGPSLVYIVQADDLQQYPTDSPWLSDDTPDPDDLVDWNPLGRQRAVRVDLYHVEVQPGDRVALTSPLVARLMEGDGLRTLLDAGPEAAVLYLARLAGQANLSAIVVEILGQRSGEQALLYAPTTRSAPPWTSWPQPVGPAPLDGDEMRDMAGRVWAASSAGAQDFLRRLLPSPSDTPPSAAPPPRARPAAPRAEPPRRRASATQSQSIPHTPPRGARPSARHVEVEVPFYSRGQGSVYAAAPPDPGIPLRGGRPSRRFQPRLAWLMFPASVLVVLLAVSLLLQWNRGQAATPEVKTLSAEAAQYNAMMEQDRQFKLLYEQTQQRATGAQPGPTRLANGDPKPARGLTLSITPAALAPVDPDALVAGVVTFTIQGDGPFFAYASPYILDHFTQTDLHLHWLNGKYVFYIGPTPPEPGTPTPFPTATLVPSGLSSARVPTPNPTALTSPNQPYSRLRNLGAIPFSDVALAPQPPSDYRDIQDVKDGHVYVIFTPDGVFAKFQVVASDLPYPRDRPGRLLLKWVYQPSKQRQFR